MESIDQADKNYMLEVKNFNNGRYESDEEISEADFKKMCQFDKKSQTLNSQTFLINFIIIQGR